MIPRFDSPNSLCCSFALAVGALLFPQSAEAGDLGKVQLTVGAKGGASGNFLSEPDNGPAGVAAPFEEGAGGWGGGGGLFAETRFLKGHLGVETGLAFDFARNKSTITWNDTVETEWGWKQLQLRVPLLIQGGTSDQKDKPRFAVGVGPEFVIPVSSKPHFAITEGEAFIDESFFADGFTVNDKAYVNFLANIGLGIPVGPVRLTFDLRYALGLGLGKDYDERVDFEPLANPIQTDVLARYNMDLRVLLGVGYDFKFGGK
jgi:hypothetical protein